MTKYNQQTDEQIVITVDKYIQRISYTASGMTEYVGLALPGSGSDEAKWQIKKLTYSGTAVVSSLFAGGNTNFTNIWDNRASLSYS